ncbi:MAG: GapR family DNA-binding domain-containing protein [Bacteroidota bacterium]|nr:GapR family DNA-binding domain-containing protein [Bacteroidota bacterium]
MNSETVKELVERLTRIESEQKLLAEDKKHLIAEYKDKLDVKAVQAAIRVAKIRAKLDTSDQEFDNIMYTVNGSLSLNNVE